MAFPAPASRTTRLCLKRATSGSCTGEASSIRPRCCPLRRHGSRALRAAVAAVEAVASMHLVRLLLRPARSLAALLGLVWCHCRPAQAAGLALALAPAALQSPGKLERAPQQAAAVELGSCQWRWIPWWT